MKIPFSGMFKRTQIYKKLHRYMAIRNTMMDLTIPSGFEDINSWIKTNLNTVRDQSRTASATNPYFKRLLTAVPSNVLGRQGIMLRPNAKLVSGADDVRLNKAVNKAWKKFSKKGNFDVSGKSRLHHEKMILKQLLIDGEYFGRIKINKKFPDKVSVQLLDPAACPATYNEKERNGVKIVNGISFDVETGAVISYWFADSNKGDQFAGTSAFNNATSLLTEIPANEIIHIFERTYPNQARGIPKSTQGLKMMRNLDGIAEASVIATRLGASSVLMLEQDEMSAGKDAFTGDNEDEFGNESIDMAPGQVNILPKGYKVGAGFSPTFPAAMVGGLEKSFLQQVAAVFDVSYHTFTGDYTKVNFSSGKLGIQEEREHYIDLQTQISEEFDARIYEIWLPFAAMSRKIVDGRTVFPASVTVKLDEPEFVGRKWAMLEPAKDAKANADQVSLLTKSRQQIAREQGDEWETVKSELREEAEFEAELNQIRGPIDPVDTTQEPDPVPPKKEGEE